MIMLRSKRSSATGQVPFLNSGTFRPLSFNANGGLLRIGYPSPGSETGRGGSEIANSLRRIFEKLRFWEIAAGDRV